MAMMVEVWETTMSMAEGESFIRTMGVFEDVHTNFQNER
jgi:hypothetical protein